MPQARSWLSRTMVLKAVRMSASCCSLATERKRFQITSSVTGSMASLFINKVAARQGRNRKGTVPFPEGGLSPFLRPSLSSPFLSGLSWLENLVDEKKIRKERAYVDQRVQIV